MKRILALILLFAGLSAGAQKYATPETFESPGPYPAGMDFSMVAAAQTPGVTFLGGDVLIGGGISEGESGISGYVTLVDAQSKKVICVYAFNHVTSSSSVSKKLRTVTPFAQLGIALRKAAVN